MTTSSSETKCTVCDNEEKPGELHGPGGNFNHPFTTPNQADWVPPRDKPKKFDRDKPLGSLARPQMVMLPQPDLALRSLLVAAGVITPEQLKEAEDALRFPGSSDPVLPDRSHSG